MVNRIQEILNRYNLTSARFADTLEVPRSTISHILSERNKPSLEFIQKVLDHYPDIDTDWLIKGEGSIFGKERDLFSEIDKPSNPTRLDAQDPKILYPSEKKASQATDTNQEKYTNLREESDAETIPEEFEKQEIKPLETKIETSRKIVRIVMFYHDNTFDEYFPAMKQD
jgi:transcriptional regulator with XRE-family HTH domain